MFIDKEAPIEYSINDISNDNFSKEPIFKEIFSSKFVFICSKSICGDCYECRLALTEQQSLNVLLDNSINFYFLILDLTIALSHILMSWPRKADISQDCIFVHRSYFKSALSTMNER